MVPIPIDVRAIIETGELKDGLQEVPKGDKWSRRNFCLYLRDIYTLMQYKKGYKNPISNLTHRTTGFWVPLFASMQPFTSLLYK
jgi:hypothetical protein